jgi:hypothetical protein
VTTPVPVEGGVAGGALPISAGTSFDIEKFETEVVVHHQGRPRRFSLRAKKIYRDSRLVRIKAEHDDLCRICAQLREADLPFPLAILKAKVEDTLGRESDVTKVDIVTDQVMY